LCSCVRARTSSVRSRSRSRSRSSICTVRSAAGSSWCESILDREGGPYRGTADRCADQRRFGSSDPGRAFSHPGIRHHRPRVDEYRGEWGSTEVPRVGRAHHFTHKMGTTLVTSSPSSVPVAVSCITHMYPPRPWRTSSDCESRSSVPTRWC
jgi:hypothetical protein